MYVHDLWVNWEDGMSKGYSIPYFHEWVKSDEISLMDQMPVVLVTSELFDSILNGFDPLPAELLKDIQDKAYQRVNHERKQLKYAAVITDGKDVVAIDTSNENVPNFKSRVIPRQHRLVLDIVENRQPKKYDQGPIVTLDSDPTAAGRVINLENVHMYGLTRRERQMKELLVENLFVLLCSENVKEVEYWYTELFPGKEVLQTIEEMVEEMSIFIKNGWGKQHEEFGATLAKYLDSYEGLWDVLEKVKNRDRVGEA